jgi:hypothetical protein
MGKIQEDFSEKMAFKGKLKKVSRIWGENRWQRIFQA